MKPLTKETNTPMEKIKDQIIKKYLLKFRIDQNKKVILFFVLGLLIILSITLFQDKNETQGKKFYLDSTIPEGFVLVPVTIINGSSLSNMIGRNGVVDLYLTDNGKKTKKAAGRVKIVQATDDIDSFAVLLKEDQSHKILSFEEPFFAVVQNPRIKSKEIFQNGKNRIVINYQN